MDSAAAGTLIALIPVTFLMSAAALIATIVIARCRYTRSEYAEYHVWVTMSVVGTLLCVAALIALLAVRPWPINVASAISSLVTLVVWTIIQMGCCVCARRDIVG